MFGKSSTIPRPREAYEALQRWELVRQEPGGIWVIGPYRSLSEIVDALYARNIRLSESELSAYLRGKTHGKDKRTWTLAALEGVATLGGASDAQLAELRLLWEQADRKRRQRVTFDLPGVWHLAIEEAEAATHHAHYLRVYEANADQANVYARQARQRLVAWIEILPDLAHVLAPLHGALMQESLAARTELTTGPGDLLDATTGLVRETWQLYEATSPSEDLRRLEAMGRLRMAVAHRFSGNSNWARQDLDKAWEYNYNSLHQLLVARERLMVETDQGHTRDIEFWRGEVERLMAGVVATDEVQILIHEALAQAAHRIEDHEAALTALDHGWKAHQMLPGQRRRVRYRTLQLLRAQEALRARIPQEIEERRFVWQSPPLYRAIEAGELSGYDRIVELLRSFRSR